MTTGSEDDLAWISVRGSLAYGGGLLTLPALADHFVTGAGVLDIRYLCIAEVRGELAFLVRLPDATALLLEGRATGHGGLHWPRPCGR